MGRNGQDQTASRDQPLAQLLQHSRLIGDVLENVESGDEVVSCVRVQVGNVPVGHPQAGASARDICCLIAQLKTLDTAVIPGKPLQHAKHVAAAASDLEDAEAVSQLSDRLQRESRDRLV